MPVSDRAAVQAALARDGIVIVTDLPGDEPAPEYWAGLAGELPALIFGEADRIPGAPPVSAVHHETTKYNQQRELQRIHGMEGEVLNGDTVDELFTLAEQEGWRHFTTVPWSKDLRSNPHTDGYGHVYGDHLPDHIFLLMETQAEEGGESWFVDGERVLDRLKAEPDAESLLPLLTGLVYDQTESASNGGLYQGRESKGHSSSVALMSGCSGSAWSWRARCRRRRLSMLSSFRLAAGR